MECDIRHCPFTQAANTSIKSSRVELLEFLFQQRLSLFNTRRDHEWKIFFGVMFILGAVDTTLLAYKDIRMAAKDWWPWCVAVLFLATTAFQVGVQSRNHADRRAMDAFHNEMCEEINLYDPKRRDQIKVGVDCSVRQKTYPDMWHITYVWAFCCEISVLAVACLLSAKIPVIFK